METPQREEVSVAKRHFLFSLACSHVLLASGEAYGWTALRPVLIDSGLFDSFPPEQQASMLNAVATMGIAANALCKLPLGIFLDSFGPRWTAVLGSALLLVGALLMALADKQSQPLMMLGYFLLGVAGPFLQMPCFQFSELYGKAGKADAMASLITCFELSTGVFVVFSKLHDMFQLDRSQLFLGYSGVGIYCMITALFFWPDLPYRSPPPPEKPPVYQHKDDHAHRRPPPAPRAPPKNLLIDRPLISQIFSVPFMYVTCFLTIHIFRQGFVLATLGPQIEEFFTGNGGADAHMLITSFNIILPLGFVPMMLCTASGFAGFILNRPRLAFIVVTLLSMVYGLLLLVHEQAAYFTLFIIFPVARQFVFSTFFSFSANTFGYASFGRIAGVASTFAGLTQLTQTKVVEYIKTPGAWLTWDRMDLFLGTIPIILIIYPIASFISDYWDKREKAKDLSSGWEPAVVGGHEDHDDIDSPLLGPSGRYDDRKGNGLQTVTADDDEEGGGMYGQGAMEMSYTEATSYGSYSASSFAASYGVSFSKHDDLRVMVRQADRAAADGSIHVTDLSGHRAAGGAAGGLNWPKFGSPASGGGGRGDLV